MMMVWEEEEYFGIVINITPDLLNKIQEHTRKKMIRDFVQVKPGLVKLKRTFYRSKIMNHKNKQQTNDDDR